MKSSPMDEISGKKRNLNAASGSQHVDKELFAIDFYEGSRRSEKTIIERYLESFAGLKGKYSSDALYLSSVDLQKQLSSTGGELWGRILEVGSS
jgi:hypothetical protein